MTQTVTLDLHQTVEFNSALFWRIVDWCLREGATDFTLSLTYSSYDSVQHQFEQIKELLRPYELPLEKRWKPVLCAWEEDEATPLWRLTEESILALKVNRLFDSAVTRRKNDRRLIYVDGLCLYRQGDPMLAVFIEQHPEVSVFVRAEEIKLFCQDHLEVMGSYDPKICTGEVDVPNLSTVRHKSFEA
jgi:hypothetical protein